VIAPDNIVGNMSNLKEVSTHFRKADLRKAARKTAIGFIGTAGALGLSFSGGGNLSHEDAAAIEPAPLVDAHNVAWTTIYSSTDGAVLPPHINPPDYAPPRIRFMWGEEDWDKHWKIIRPDTKTPNVDFKKFQVVILGGQKVQGRAHFEVDVKADDHQIRFTGEEVIDNELGESTPLMVVAIPREIGASGKEKVMGGWLVIDDRTKPKDPSFKPSHTYTVPQVSSSGK
jgi:hypothetical protein